MPDLTLPARAPAWGQLEAHQWQGRGVQRGEKLKHSPPGALLATDGGWDVAVGPADKGSEHSELIPQGRGPRLGDAQPGEEPLHLRDVCWQK